MPLIWVGRTVAERGGNHGLNVDFTEQGTYIRLGLQAMLIPAPSGGQRRRDPLRLACQYTFGTSTMKAVQLG